MDADILTLEQILHRILNTEPADKAQGELLSTAWARVPELVWRSMAGDGGTKQNPHRCSAAGGGFSIRF